MIKNSICFIALHIVAQNHSFSSYAGRLYSGDDFYVLSSGLVMNLHKHIDYITLNCFKRQFAL